MSEIQWQKNDDGSITCIGEVPTHSVLRVLNGSKESLLAAVKSATESVVSQLKGQSLAGVLIFFMRVEMFISGRYVFLMKLPQSGRSLVMPFL